MKSRALQLQMFTQLFAPNLGLFQHYLVIFVLMNELSIKQNLAEEEKEEEEDDIEESEEEESEDESEGKAKHKGTEGLIQIENPNLVKAKNIKAKEVDLGKTTELSRREREEIEKQKAHERYMKLQEQGKTEQARKDLERLALIRQQRADAAKKREEEKAAKEQRKAEARK